MISNEEIFMFPQKNSSVRLKRGSAAPPGVRRASPLAVLLACTLLEMEKMCESASKSVRAARLLIGLGATFTLATSITGASAAIVTYDSASAWTAAVSSVSTVNFNGFIDSQSISEGTNYTEGGVNFALSSPSPVGAIYGVGPSYGATFSPPVVAGTFYGSGYLEWQNNSSANPPLPNTLDVTLPSAVNAIGFDYAELRGKTDVYTIVADGQTFTETTSTSGDLFFGLTDTNRFTSFTITDLNSNSPQGLALDVFPTIDNVSYGIAVPEASTCSMIAIGGVALLGLMFRKRHRTA
jgi:hypothetical protein